MNRVIAPLLLVLVIQCFMVAAVYWPAPVGEGQTPMQRLATTSPEQVDEIRIGDEYDNEAVLQRAGERWLLPVLDGLPADNARVAQMLQGILPEDATWPVADSAAARQRFQVADYLYQRRITLLRRGAVLESIYLGTAPAFRKVHARNAAGGAIFTLTFNSFDAPAIDDAWLDRRLLQLRSPLAVTADAYSVYWQDGHWLSGSGAQPDQRELDALLGALRSLQVEGVADEDTQRELSQAEADLVLKVKGLAGDVTLELFALDDQYYIYSNRYNLFFDLSAYDYDRLTGIDLARISGSPD